MCINNISQFFFRLKFIETDIKKKEEEEKIEQEKRKKQNEENAGKTKRLGANKFVEPDLVYNNRDELRGSLRLLNKSGSLLTDRFYSLQKRNILAPSSKVTRYIDYFNTCLNYTYALLYCDFYLFYFFITGLEKPRLRNSSKLHTGLKELTFLVLCLKRLNQRKTMLLKISNKW